MRLISAALPTTVALALLTGCSGNAPQMTPTGAGGTGQTQPFTRGHHKPVWSYPASAAGDTVAPFRYSQIISGFTRRRGAATGGIYASQFYGPALLGYQHKNTSNKAPVCTIATGLSYFNDIAVDGKGNLMAPVGYSPSGKRLLSIYKGPGLCGTLLGTISDPYGQPADASSRDAVNGKIALGNIFDNGRSPGSVSVCTMAGGCTKNLTNAAMYEVAGVAMDKHGNCWASALDSGSQATLTYFAGCRGRGAQATGFMNSDYGGLDIDKNGNLVSLDYHGQRVWIYSGCNPACTLVGGPYSLQGASVFGHVNGQSMTFAAADHANNSIDVYYYSPSSLTYWYSFDNGLSASLSVVGVAYSPSSQQ